MVHINFPDFVRAGLIVESAEVEVAPRDIEDIRLDLDDPSQAQDAGEFVDECWGRGSRINEVELWCCEESDKELAV